MSGDLSGSAKADRADSVRASGVERHDAAPLALEGERDGAGVAKLSVGVDLVDVARMARALARTPGLKKRLFTTAERRYCDRQRKPAEHYAARFAAREAVLKALGCGFRGVGWKDVSVALDEAGKPQALLSGAAWEKARALGVQEVAISLSHTSDIACANAALITADVRPKPAARSSEERYIASSFKEARSIVFELEKTEQEELGEFEGAKGE